MLSTPAATGATPLVSIGMLAYIDRAYVATAITDLLRLSFTAVSYIHLDVYKRQSYPFSLMRGKAW